MNTKYIFLKRFKTDKNIVSDPISIFSSNPERGLIWLAKLWNDEIAVNVPGAKLCLFAGHETYGGRKKDKISNILDSIRELNSSYIEVNKPVTKNELFKKLILSREKEFISLMLIFGHIRLLQVISEKLNFLENFEVQKLKDKFFH